MGTGDATVGTNPQDLRSLGGKTLRVRTDGTVPPDNPFASAADPRTRLVYTYGHRNVQGLALRPGTRQMWAVEHGPDVNDEVNVLAAGRNYGWDPVPGYNQRVPMTDRRKFPGAVRARWSSGRRTVATSGATFLSGAKWGSWRGGIAVAALKGSELLVLSPRGRVLAVLRLGYGRLRAAQLGPDGNLYVSTDNGSNDRILRLAPRG
jgi:glucose/arabinose dehydrogenase